MLFSKGKLQLIPDSPDVVLHGTPRDARCFMISGLVVLTTKTPRSVSSLIIRFRPKQEDLLNPAMSIATLSEITCTVVKDGRPSNTSAAHHNLYTGQSTWRFAMGVPGNLNESVFSPSAFIAYELVAELRMASPLPWGPFNRLSCQIPIAVKRLPTAESTWSALANEPLAVAAKWRDRIELTTLADARLVHDNGCLTISGVVRPMAKGLRVLRAGFEIREFIEGPFDSPETTYQRGVTVARCSRDISAASLEVPQDGINVCMQFPPSASTMRRSGVDVDQEIQVTGHLAMPRAYDDIQYDILTGPIRVSHELVFAISVVDEGGQVHNVRLSSAIYVLPRVNSVVVELPRYENSDKDVLLAAGSDRRYTLVSSSESRDTNETCSVDGVSDNESMNNREPLPPPPEYSESFCLTWPHHTEHRRVPPHVQFYHGHAFQN